MQIKVSIGNKFILGFIMVVAVVVFVPGSIAKTGVVEWARQPLSVLIAIVIGLILGAIFTRSFTRHFNLISDTARRISIGDLTRSDTLAKRKPFFADETVDLELAVISMNESLRSLVEQINKTVDNLTDAQESISSSVAKGHETSKAVISGTSRIFAGAIEQANHIGEAATTVKSMAELADEVATKITEGVNSSQKVNTMVQKGATSVTSAMEKMESIFSDIEKNERATLRLQEKINDIPKILDVITHISRQTDLLALNATIEASKAGEHGRGFAMVAEEVRRFADNTNDSVQDVSLLVKEIRSEVERVVYTANEGASNLKGGREDLRKIREILSDITEYTSEVAEKATLILGLTHKQKEKAGRTVEITTEVARIAKENVTSTEHVETAVERHGETVKATMAASDRLAERSSDLMTVVSRFVLDNKAERREAS